MTTIGDANTLLSWACSTMSTDGWDVSTVQALLPVRRVADLPAVEDAVAAVLVESWRPFWVPAQDQVWAEVPAIDLPTLIAADNRAQTIVKRIMRLTSAVRMRKLAVG